VPNQWRHKGKIRNAIANPKSVTYFDEPKSRLRAATFGKTVVDQKRAEINHIRRAHTGRLNFLTKPSFYSLLASKREQFGFAIMSRLFSSEC